MSKPKLIVFGDPDRRFAAEVLADFLDFIGDRVEIVANCFHGDCSLDTLKQADFAVVFGGDGTILSAARQLSESSVPVIGVNVGKLGFLAKFAPGELEKLFDDVVTGKCEIEKRMILSYRVFRGDEQTYSKLAVNDVVITAGPQFSMIELQVSVQGAVSFG